MTQEEIIEMARQAGFPTDYNDKRLLHAKEIEAFAKLVRNDYSNKHAQLWIKRVDDAVKAEREACAKVCDYYAGPFNAHRIGECADAMIKARSEA